MKNKSINKLTFLKSEREPTAKPAGWFANVIGFFEISNVLDGEDEMIVDINWMGGDP